MRKVWLIARREYLDKVRSKAFLITTVLFPVMMLGFGVLPGKFMTQRKGGTRHIVIVTSSQATGQQVQKQLRDASRSGLNFAVELSNDTSEGNRDVLRRRLDVNAIDGFLWAD